MPPAPKANGHAEEYISPFIEKLGSEIQRQSHKLDEHLADYKSDRHDMTQTLDTLKCGMESVTGTMEDLGKSLKQVSDTVHGYEAIVTTTRRFILKALTGAILAAVTGAAGVVGSAWLVSHSKPTAPAISEQFVQQQQQRDAVILQKLNELSTKPNKK